ncbi:MAG: hypothetical protein ACOCXQ_04230, partial [Patescibacteria group bacterium]
MKGVGMSGTAPIQTSFAYITNVLRFGPPMYPSPLNFLRQLSDQQLSEIAVLLYARHELGIQVVHAAFPDRLLIPIQDSQIPLDKLRRQLITQVRNEALRYQMCEGSRLFPVLLMYLITPENVTSEQLKCVSANLKSVLMDDRVSSDKIYAVLKRLSIAQMMNTASPQLCIVPTAQMTKKNLLRHTLKELERLNCHNLYVELLWSYLFDSFHGVDEL